MEYLIGLDIGTQGAKGLLIDRDGKQVGSSYSGYDVLQPKPLWAEQWPEVWVEGVCKTLRSLLETASVDAGQISFTVRGALHPFFCVSLRARSTASAALAP